MLYVETWIDFYKAIIELCTENMMGHLATLFVTFMNYSALTGDPGQELDSVELLGNNFLKINFA